MEAIQKNRVLFITIIALVVLNIATLATIWMMFNQQSNKRNFSDLAVMGQRMQPMIKQGFMEKNLEKRIGFSDEQMNEFEILKTKQIQKNDSLMRQIRSQTLTLNGLIALDNFNPSQYNELVEKIGLLQSEIVKLNFEHFRNVRKICTTEQKIKFDRFLESELFNRMAPMMPQSMLRGMKKNSSKPSKTKE